ncbi:hypothetical protein F4780DRAFT_782701 [Xylariomycetidae sp. FL0641]|nr:hypothetical protein F4780DRAFT_782701 [Xylariomycetidae sp. FL0641]
MSGMERQQGEQPAKLSRYRSQRGRSVSTIPSSTTTMAREARNPSHAAGPGMPGAQPSDAASGNSIARSMSRYRRRANSVSVHADATQKLDSDPPHPFEASPPPVPAIPRTLIRDSDAAAAAAAASTGAARRQKGNGDGGDPEDTDPPLDHSSSSPLPPPRHQLRRTDTRHQQRHLRQRMADHQNHPTMTTATAPADDSPEPRRMTGREERRQRFEEQDDTTMQAEETAHIQNERDRILAEQKKKDLQRLEVELANTQRNLVQAQKPRSPILEKFSILTKGRKNKDGLSPTSSSGSVDVTSPRLPAYEPPKAKPLGIEVGGKGIVPQTDAPTSAINSGDRNVTVRCRHHTFNIEVTPETTPVDVLFQTSNNMSYDLEINPSSCVVIETYGRLGLERRLRRYERIRDVMNSWDRDSQNQLVVTPCESEEENRELDIIGVPQADETSGFQLYLYHSNRPGKWNKRWVTLLENGQILCSKKPNANTADKDTANLCRLSDYDIYTPTESQMRRQLKPPKRYCFAVKSQQKTTVFLNTENYVQYFSTEDPKIAAQFREMIHGWRSRYLADRRPNTKKPLKISIPKTDEKAPQITPVTGHAPQKSINVAAVDGHRLRVSIDESPYSIGQFEPLLDMKRFDKRLSQFGKDFLPTEPDVSTMPRINPSQLHHPSQDAKNGTKNGTKNETKLIDTIHSASNGDSAFTGGLLGDAYNERKQAQASNERTGRPPPPPQPETPVDKPESPSWFPSALEHSAKRRVTPTRPSTSAGVVNRHGRRPSMSAATSRPPPVPLPLTGGAIHSNSGASSGGRPSTAHHQHPHPLGSQPTGMSATSRDDSGRRAGPPAPLVNITPTFQEPPQWSREGKGHGVRAPEGMMHLVDLISVGGPNGKNNRLEVPPRSVLRRPAQQSAPPSLSRTRSKSGGAPPARPFHRDAVPPVPKLPGTGATEKERGRAGASDRDKERARAQSKAREREYRDREAAYNANPGRAGTLKVV